MSKITDEVFDRVLALSELELDMCERERIKKDMEVLRQQIMDKKILLLKKQINVAVIQMLRLIKRKK